MGRRKKCEQIKRTNNVMVRFTDAEYASISISAEQAGYPVAVYVRKSALDERIEVHYNITAELPELQKLIAEYSAIGNNLNQIAQYFQKELEDINEQIIADGMNPMETTFQTRKQFVRNAVSEISSSAISFEDFQSQLFEKYKIHVKENRGRYSYLHPEREKYISGRSLGTNFDKDYLLNLFEANALAAEQEEKQRQTMPDYHADPIAILFIRSDLRLVVDLQNCIKAQQSRAYAQKVKISNLQQMAKTVAYIQENGFDTRENLQTTYDSITLQMHDARQKTKDTETQIKSVNEQIHYLGQYLSTKSTYNEFLKARFKGKFRKDHADEIEKHEKAAQILKAQNPDGSLPKMKDLKLEKERLLALKAAQYDTYTYYKDYQKELRTACANVDSILGQHHIRDHIQRTEQTL